MFRGHAGRTLHSSNRRKPRKRGGDMTSRPLDITVTARTSASPEQVLAAVRDFSPRRPRLWPNVKAKYFEVHERGPDYAEVTEGIWIAGRFWERERYDWSQRGVVRSVVTDSNVVEPGCLFEVRALPADGGSEVEMAIHRTFKRGVKGRIGGTVNRLSGQRGWGSYLRRVLRNVEGELSADELRSGHGQTSALAPPT